MKTRLFALLFILITSIPSFSQESENKDSIQNFSLSADFVTNYIWRGLSYSDVPNIQPSISYTTNNGIFTLGAFGSYSLANYYSEVDLYASLSLGMFTFEVWDYFGMTDTLANNRFFDFKDESTGHALEAIVMFNGPESFPIQFTAGTFFYGNDKDFDGENYYSTYFELAYPFKWKRNNLTVFAGCTPKEGIYGSEFAFNNIGITNEREIRITDNFSIPIKGSIIINPHLENIYFNLAITLEAND